MNAAAQSPEPRTRSWRLAGWSLAVVLLLTPLVAMQFGSQVNWGLPDFVFAALLIGGTGLLLELAVRMNGSLAYRAGVAIALLAAVLLAWINLAVGVIGAEDNPANLMFFAVIGMAFAGSALARLQAAGMALAMTTAALAQAAIAVVVVASGMEVGPPLWPHFVVFTGFFVALWLAAAALLRSAARLGTGAGA